MELRLQPYLNRRLLANYQRTTRPIFVGPWGLLQPFADGAKLVFKGNLLIFLVQVLIFFTNCTILALYHLLEVLCL